MYRETLDGDRIYLLHEFLSPDECQELIDLSEGLGYDDAPITTRAGFVMRKDIRNNDRVMLDDAELAGTFYRKALAELPARFIGGKVVCGLNERLRFYRYRLRQRFARHSDGYFERENGERSRYTFMIYLNDDFTGGETIFSESDRIVVKPLQGSALIFYHHQLHEGAEVTEGTKYVVRSDVMYRHEEAV